MSPHELKIVGDYLWDRAYARGVDRLTSEQFLIPALVLMENAGRAMADAILDLGAEDEPVLVLAGLGNNGGDALVCARYLSEEGREVHVFTVARDEAAQATELTARQLAILEALALRPVRYQPGVLARFADREPLVIDGVLGLGFHGELAEDSPLYQALAEAATLREATVFAVDVPSGLDVDSGEHQEIPLPADVTVTFGGRKPAHVLAPCRDLCGEVLCLDIGFPKAAQDAALGVHRPALVQPDAAELVRNDPWSALPRSAHKYDRGHVLIIGGSRGKTGAPLLAALAALRAGAGWASVAMPQSALQSLRGEVPRELVFEALFDGEKLNAVLLERFLEERRVRAVVAGPGAVVNPLDAEAMAILQDFTKDAGGFVVLDAGACHGLAPLLENLELRPERWIATPHPGEWRRLGGGIEASPLTPAGLKLASSTAERLGIALLYKHATPLLVTGDPTMPGFVVAEGTQSLARAGSGDLLTGAIGAHGAAGLLSVTAALRGQVVIAWAARLAAEEVGAHGVLARDILDQIGNVATLLERDEDEEGDE